MHRILLSTVVIDSPSGTADAERDFWATALGAAARRGTKFPEYHVLEKASSPLDVMVQDVGDATPRVHLDIASSDVEAEVTRLTKAGASVVHRAEHWVVLRDPAGLVFCVVPGQGEEFERNSSEVR